MRWIKLTSLMAVLGVLYIIFDTLKGNINSDTPFWENEWKVYVCDALPIIFGVFFGITL